MSIWEIGLFEVGDCRQCLYSWCCPGCALAQSRSNIDGSSCLFNYFNFCSCGIVALIRSGYGMEQKCCTDCLLLSCPFTSLCFTNQIYQTSVIRKLPTRHIRGREFNRSVITTPCGVKNFCCGFCCAPCALASDVERSTTVNYYTACFAMSIMAKHQVLRYQYTIRGEDEKEECWIPCCLTPLGPAACCYVAHYQGKMRDYLDANGRTASIGYLQD